MQIKNSKLKTQNSKLVVIITALLVFGISLFFAPTNVESSHGQAGPATSCSLSNYQDIPETVTANTPMQFTATFSPALSPPYKLLGRICINKDGSSQGCSLKDSSGSLVPWGTVPAALTVTAGTTYNHSFTPSAPGTYKVFCSSSNANDYECRGATQGDIDSLGKDNVVANHPCEGGTSSKGFTVTAAAAPPAAAAPAQPPESTPNIRQSTRRNGDTVQVDFSATDKSDSGIKEIVVAIWEGAANFQEKWSPLESAPAGKRGRYEPIQDTSSGTIQVKIPSYIEYYAVDNNGNKENNGQGKSYLVSATDDTRPSTSITKPGDPASYVRRQQITLKYISDYDRKVGSIRRKAIRVTEDITLSNEAEIQNYISTHQDAWNQARTVEMRPDPPLNHVEMDDLEPIRIPAVVEYFAIGEDDRSETKKYAFIPASNPEQTAKVRIAESEVDLNDGGQYREYTFSELPATGSDQNRRRAAIQLRGYGQKTIFVRYISNAGNVRDETFGTITYAPLANCSNLRGADRGFVGEELKFIANFAPPAGAPAFDLKGEIAAGIDGGDDKRECSSKVEGQGCTNLTDLNDSGENDKQMAVRFSQPGTYTVFCDAFNLTQFVECRGDQRFVTGSTNPRVRVCAGPSSSKQITIERDETAPTTTMTINPSTNIYRGSNVAVTLSSSDTQSKVRTVFVGIWKNKKSKAEATGNPDITCEYGNTTNNCPGVRSTTLQDGAVQIEFRDIPIPSYIETNAIDYSGNQEKDIGVQQISQSTGGQSATAGNPANAHPVVSDDKGAPASLVSFNKVSGKVGRDEEVDINFVITDTGGGIHAVFARVWEGATTKAGAGRDISIVGNGRKEISETKKAKAPFYLEYHAEDINGNVENIPQTEEGSTDIPGGRRAHTRIIDVDRTPPILNAIQVESREVINNGDEVTLTFTASDPEGSGVRVVHAMVYEGTSTKPSTTWENPAGRPAPYRPVTLNAQGIGTTTAKVPFFVDATAEDNCNCEPKTGGGFTGKLSTPQTVAGVNNDIGTDKNPTSSLLKLQLKKAGTTDFVDIDSAAGKTFARGDVVKLTLKANDTRDKPGFSAIKQINVGIWRGVTSKADIWNSKATTPPANSGKTFTYVGLTPTGVLSSPAPGVSPSPASTATPAPPASPQPDESTISYTCVDDSGSEPPQENQFARLTFLSSAPKYALRVDKKSNPWIGCDNPNTGDFCDEISQNQKTFFAGDGNVYDVWYHTIDSAGNLSAASKHLTVTCPRQFPGKEASRGTKLARAVLGVSSSTGEVQESIEAEAPFYLEYTAQDINGNFEKDNQNPNSFSAVLDSKAPTVSEITVENQPEARNIGSEVTLKFSANDEAEGTGLKIIHTAVWVGVSSKAELIGKLKGKKAEEWDQNPSDIPLYAAVDNNGTRKAKVPFYAEARAEDNCNCVPKAGGGFTGNVTGDVTGDAAMKTLSLDHNDKTGNFRPTSNSVSVKSVADPNKTSGFAAGEQVEITFTGTDNRGVALFHTAIWEGVSTKQEALARARERNIDLTQWKNPENPFYLGVPNGGTRRATVPFYLEYVAQDINENLEDVPQTARDYADDSNPKTPGGVHAFAIEIPTQTEKIRIVQGDQRDLDTCNPAVCEKPFNPKISFPLSGGTGKKTIWVRFINNKRRDPVDVFKDIRVLSSSEGVSFVFSPASVTANPGGAQFEVAVRLNTRSTFRDSDYNISAVDIKLKLDTTIFRLVNFVPNADLFATVGSISPTATDVRFVGRRKTEDADLTGLVELGKLQLRPAASVPSVAGATTITVEESSAIITASNTVGSVPIVKPIAQATLTLGSSASPSPSPHASASPGPSVSPSPHASASPGPSVSPSPHASASPGPSASPGAGLACDFNLSGKYDDAALAGAESDLDVWTKAALGQRIVTGASWDADCTGPAGSEDGKADILDLNNWLVLFERQRLSR